MASYLSLSRSNVEITVLRVSAIFVSLHDHCLCSNVLGLLHVLVFILKVVDLLDQIPVVVTDLKHVLVRRQRSSVRRLRPESSLSSSHGRVTRIQVRLRSLVAGTGATSHIPLHTGKLSGAWPLSSNC